MRPRYRMLLVATTLYLVVMSSQEGKTDVMWVMFVVLLLIVVLVVVLIVILIVGVFSVVLRWGVFFFRM